MHHYTNPAEHISTKEQHSGPCCCTSRNTRSSADFKLERSSYGEAERLARFAQRERLAERLQHTLEGHVAGAAGREHVSRDRQGRACGRVQAQWIVGPVDTNRR